MLPFKLATIAAWIVINLITASFMLSGLIRGDAHMLQLSVPLFLISVPTLICMFNDKDIVGD